MKSYPKLCVLYDSCVLARIRGILLKSTQAMFSTFDNSQYSPSVKV